MSSAFHKISVAAPIAVLLNLGGLVDARAQTISPEKIASAQRLYDEAIVLIEANNFEQACPKLEEAVQLVPEGVGAKLELAKCYEGAQRYASAWRAFKIAEAATAIAGQAERHERAKERAAAIQAKLSTLTIIVPESLRQLPGFVMTRNGTTVDRTDWDTPIPVDGGSYRLEATATGKQTWLRVVEIGPSNARVRVEIGMLENAEPKSIEPPQERSWQQPLGATLAGAGGVGAVVGFIVGGAALSKYATSNEQGRCDAQNRCDQAGLDIRKDAIGLANISTSLVIVGGVLLAGGVVLWSTAPKKSEPAATARAPKGSDITAQIEAGPSGVWLRGKW